MPFNNIQKALSGKGKYYSFKDLALILALALAYLGAAKLGLRFASVNPSATAIWPATGVSIAALLVLGIRFWPGIFLGAFVANITTAGTVLTSLGISLGNTLEAVVAVHLLIRFNGGREIFRHSEDVFGYLLFAGMISPAVSATFGVTSLLFSGLANTANYFSIWLTWWLGDMGGAMVVAPFLILWFGGHFFNFNVRRSAEALLIFIVLILVSFMLFGGVFHQTVGNYPVEYLSIPFLIWVAMRFGQRESALAVLVISVIATIGTLNGFGPFVIGDINTSLLLLQIFLIVTAVMVHLMSVLIAERDATEEQLKDQAIELQIKVLRDEALLNSMGEGMVAIDKDGFVITINRTALRMLGWSKEDLTNKRFSDFVRAEIEDGTKIKAEDRPAERVIRSRTGLTITKDFYYVRQDGTRFPVAMVVTPLILSGQIYGAIAVFRDVTAEKEIERAQTEFVSIASHQLRTPLTSIHWYSEALSEDVRLDDKQKKYINNILSANERLIKLTNELLDASRIESKKMPFKPEPVNVSKFSDSVVKDFELLILNKKLLFEKRYGKSMDVLSVDSNIIRIVLQNLLSNAIKYTPEGGRISLTVDKVDRNLAIDISDSGYGMPKSQISKVFTKFFRADNIKTKEPDGTGLGLYIVKSVLDRIGGTISFDTEEGKGTSFHVTIPFQSKDSAGGNVV